MRKFKFEQINSTPYKGLDGTVIFGDGTESTHKILIEAVNGLGVPQSSVQIQQAPFQVGASPIRSTFGPRTISLECAIIIDCKSEAGKAAMEAVKRDLGNKFSPAGMGYVPDTSLTGSNSSTVTGKLSYASDGVTYDRFIDCVPISCEFPQRSYSDGFQRFRLALFCPDPTWYDAEQSSLMTSVVNPGMDYIYDSCFAEEIGIFCSVGTKSFTSRDGVIWTEGNLASVGAYSWRCVVWANTLGKFIAFDPTSAKTTTSTDGVTWTAAISVGYLGAANNKSLAWSESLGILTLGSLISFGSATVVYWSTTGTSWTAGTTGGNINPEGCVWSQELGIFVMVGTGGTYVQTSVDGKTWITRSGSGDASCITWSRKLGLLVAGGYGADRVQTSPDGTTWTQSTPVIGTPQGISCSDKLELLVIVGTSGSIYTSTNGTTWTARTGTGSYNNTSVVFAESVGMFVTGSYGGSGFSQISYDGVQWFRSVSSDYTKQITNDGDVPAEFEIDIPVVGGETSKVIAIGDNFLWSGTGTPPSDHNLVFGTDGLKKGTVTVSTKFNAKDITQFGVSKFNLYQQGTFFSLYVSGATTNNIYVRNTGTSAGAPTIRWKNRYLGV